MDATSGTVRLGAAQVAEVYLDTEATIEKDCEYVRRAGDRDINLLVFPEFHVARPTWYRYDDRDFMTYYRRVFEEAITVPGPEVDRIKRAAAEAGTAVVLGATEKRPGTSGTMFNSLVFVDADGTLLGVRRKLMPTMHERLFHAAGTGADVRVFEGSLGTIGGMMCGEHTNHLLGFALLGLGEAVHAAAWPAFPWLDREEREDRVGLRTRFHAYAGKVPTVLATGTVTDELAAALDDDVSTGAGASAIVGPDGAYRAGPKPAGEGIVSAEIDLAERVEGKALHDVVGHYNRFDVFDLRVDRRNGEPVTVLDEADEAARAGAESDADRSADAGPAGDVVTDTVVPDTARTAAAEREYRRAIGTLREHLRDDPDALSLLDDLETRLAER